MPSYRSWVLVMLTLLHLAESELKRLGLELVHLMEAGRRLSEESAAHSLDTCMSETRMSVLLVGRRWLILQYVPANGQVVVIAVES